MVMTCNRRIAAAACAGSDLIGEAAAGLAALGLGGLGVRVARRRSR